MWLDPLTLQYAMTFAYLRFSPTCKLRLTESRTMFHSCTEAFSKQPLTARRRACRLEGRRNRPSHISEQLVAKRAKALYCTYASFT